MFVAEVRCRHHLRQVLRESRLQSAAVRVADPRRTLTMLCLKPYSETACILTPNLVDIHWRYTPSRAQPLRLARSEARSEGASLEAFRAFQEACLAPGDH
eukprot:3967349-Prymnesium_polylepis.1